MGKFKNTANGVVVSVDDSKDERFAEGWEPFDGDESKPTPAKKAAAKKAAAKPDEQ